MRQDWISPMLSKSAEGVSRARECSLMLACVINLRIELCRLNNECS